MLGREAFFFPFAFDAGFVFGLALTLVTLAGVAVFGGRPLGRGEAVASLEGASFLGLPLGLGDAVTDFAAVAAFAGDADFEGVLAVLAVFLGVGNLVFVVAFVGAGGFAATVAALVAFFASAGFFNAFASFLTVEVFVFAGDVLFVNFAMSSASAFLADWTAFLGDRRREGSGVAGAFAFAVALSFFGDGVVFAFAMSGRTILRTAFCDNAESVIRKYENTP